MPLSPEDNAKIDNLYSKFKEYSQAFLGYPCNLAYDYTILERFFELSMINVGDPFDDGIYKTNTKEFERDVIAFFARLYNISENEYWGYVTNGGTEGNMYGLYLGREMYSNALVYFSEDTHYSIFKIVHMLGMRHVVIKSQQNGEMDYDDLHSVLATHREIPAIILANIGTTMKGAVDRIDIINDALQKNVIREHYIHCDAALGGMILPFVKDAPVFDFRLPVDSISVSGHKFIGMPFPSGIVIAKNQNVERIRKAIEYIGASDTTLSGSRNGIGPLMFWIAIRSLGYEGFEKRVQECLALTKYAVERCNAIGWFAKANEFYNTVVIKRPSAEIVKKWQLAVQGDMAHVIIMPHITKDKIDAFINDLTGAQTVS